jgi:DHA1 family bicyclomycin/chloramphenicol resistance-like MFS transporter
MAVNYFRILSTRESLGYTIASGLVFGGLMSYVSSSEQIYHEVYHTGAMFPIWFAGAAGAMSLSNLINSRLVERFGMRRMSHGALVGFVIVTGLHAFLALQGPVPFAIFYGLMLVAFFMIGFQGPNYSAIAMEPLGALAGSAAALIGFASSFASALIGGYIAQQFNGTITPILVGQFSVSFLALASVLWTERGRLMRPHHLPPPGA